MSGKKSVEKTSNKPKRATNNTHSLSLFVRFFPLFFALSSSSFIFPFLCALIGSRIECGANFSNCVLDVFFSHHSFTPLSPSKYTKKTDTKCSQQEMHAMRPTLTPTYSSALTFLASLFCIAFGFIARDSAREIVELHARYDEACKEGFFDSENPPQTEEEYLRSTGNGTTCVVSLGEAPEYIKAPAYVYYGVSSMYQNHRRFVRSRSNEQLMGQRENGGDVCDPKRTTIDGEDINPCGLAAWSTFNDTFAVNVDGQPRAVSTKDISWKGDRKFKFANYVAKNVNEDPATRGGKKIEGTVQEDEHFIVWMRTASTKTFRKLWGVIETDIDKGQEITVNVTNLYNSYAFGGEKRVYLSTTTWLGGKNHAFAMYNIVVGFLLLISSVVLAVLGVGFGRKPKLPEKRL